MTIQSNIRFSDKVIIVTGAASGIGKAIIDRLVLEGGTIIGIDINENLMLETVKEIKNKNYIGNISYKIINITNESDVKKVINEVIEEYKKIDVLINMAGILSSSNTIETTLDEFQHIINVNLIGTFLLCREVLPYLIKTEGNIVNAASTSTFFGHPYMAAYSASKGGIASMTKSLAWEYIKNNVRVNAVAPGGIMTPLSEKQKERMNGYDMSLFQHLTRPDYKLGYPEQIAGVVAMIASKDGSFMTGEIIKIDGGCHS